MVVVAEEIYGQGREMGGRGRETPALLCQVIRTKLTKSRRSSPTSPMEEEEEEAEEEEEQQERLHL